MSDAVTSILRCPEALVMLVSPSDRHGDAEQIARAGFRVITTSRMMQNAAQVLRSAPAAILIEFVPAYARETMEFVAALAPAARVRGISLVAYGSCAEEAHTVAMRTMGAQWIEVADAQRGAIVEAVRQALAGAGRWDGELGSVSS